MRVLAFRKRLEKSSKKGAVKIEENQKLYKHMERGESHLRYQ